MQSECKTSLQNSRGETDWPHFPKVTNLKVNNGTNKLTPEGQDLGLPFSSSETLKTRRK